VGIDWMQLQRDMDDPAIDARIQGNLQMARTPQINGTPALVIGNRMMPGAMDLARLEALVAERRDAMAQKTATR